MSREIITHWSDYRLALDRLLPMATRKILIYDADLIELQLDQPERIAQLQQVARATPALSIQIAVRDADRLRRLQPRLMQLMTLYSHAMVAQQTGAHLAHLRDSMILIDDRHGLIRFDQDHARSKLLIDEPEELSPYLHRFNELWSEPGEAVTPSTLGL